MPDEMRLSAIIPTHRPNSERLRRTLAGLRAQTLPASQWETLLVENASPVPIELASFADVAPANLRLTREPRLGLTAARLHGIAETRGQVLVFVDDDNVLAPGYLETALKLLQGDARIGAAGGPVEPEWETPPPVWLGRFHGLLALQNHGAERRVARGGPGAPWPDFAPVGAGLVVRRPAADRYVQAVSNDPFRAGLDRQAGRLSSGGDCDLIFSVLHEGGDIAYDPALHVTHLIPQGRTRPDYLARLNEGIMRSWVQVLALHGQFPWPEIPRWTVPLRAARAWWRRRAWTSPVARIEWAGDCGQFAGQADLRDRNHPR
jgi:glycosyltransferase involved in cell wall biosynthesis